MLLPSVLLGKSLLCSLFATDDASSLLFSSLLLLLSRSLGSSLGGEIEALCFLLSSFASLDSSSTGVRLSKRSFPTSDASSLLLTAEIISGSLGSSSWRVIEANGVLLSSLSELNNSSLGGSLRLAEVLILNYDLLLLLIHLVAHFLTTFHLPPASRWLQVAHLVVHYCPLGFDAVPLGQIYLPPALVAHSSPHPAPAQPA